MTRSVTTLERRRGSGFRNAMHLVDLGDGRLLVHSPTWIGEETFARVDAAGRPACLLAPNHYHHLSLGRFRERYPAAVACASAQAIRRLESKGHAGLLRNEEAESSLGDRVRLHTCEGTKNGETWVSIHDDDESVTLLVCDAYFAEPQLTGLEGWVLRRLRTGPGLAIGRTFEWMGLDDRGRYRAWVGKTLDELRPSRVLFSHGDPLEGDCAARLRDAMREVWGEV